MFPIFNLINLPAMSISTYEEAVQYLFSRQANGMKLGLENIQDLLDKLDHPESRFPSIHIAGTNGKGSTAAILESVLREADYRTGLYTSPHLIDMRERIQIRGRHISKTTVTQFIHRFAPLIEAAGASFFEILTAMAFLHFAQKNVDIAVLETGLGGRLDATNTVVPLFSLITEIGFDHTRILGKSLEKITREKTGILKPGIPCLTSVRNRRVRDSIAAFANARNVPLLFSQENVRISNIRCTETGSRFDCVAENTRYENLRLRLLGAHQIENCGLALLAVEEMKKQGWIIPETAVRRGLERVVWPARLQLIRKKPKLLLDSAHNPMGIQALVLALGTLFQYDRLILVFGVLEDKDYRKMLAKIAPLADKIIFTKPLSDRALEPDRLVQLDVMKGKRVEVIPDIEKAWKKAVSMAEEEDMVCGAGSIYFVGEVLRIMNDSQ